MGYKPRGETVDCCVVCLPVMKTKHNIDGETACQILEEHSFFYDRASSPEDIKGWARVRRIYGGHMILGEVIYTRVSGSLSQKIRVVIYDDTDKENHVKTWGVSVDT